MLEICICRVRGFWNKWPYTTKTSIKFTFKIQKTIRNEFLRHKQNSIYNFMSFIFVCSRGAYQLEYQNYYKVITLFLNFEVLASNFIALGNNNNLYILNLIHHPMKYVTIVAYIETSFFLYLHRTLHTGHGHGQWPWILPDEFWWNSWDRIYLIYI